MTEQKQTNRRQSNPKVEPKAPEVDMTALAILFSAFLKKGYSQVMAVQSAQKTYEDLKK